MDKKFHEDWYRRSSNTKLCLSNLNVVMLVLLMGEFIMYAAEMGSGAMICIPSFIKTGSAIQTLIGEIQTARCSHKPTFIFFK
jgi:hypothetical protein